MFYRKKNIFLTFKKRINISIGYIAAYFLITSLKYAIQQKTKSLFNASDRRWN